MSLAKEITVGNRTVKVPVTLADQVVNFFSPAKGSSRYHQRVRMAMSGGYSGADRSRRANKFPGKREMDADSAILPDLSTLREESQHLNRNNAIAAGAIKTNVTKVVGTGLSVKSQIDRKLLRLNDAAADQWEHAAEREYKLATETREIDAERHLPFKLYQGLAFLKTLEDGDTFINLPRFRRPGSPYSLKLQMIEAARVCNKDFAQDTMDMAGGVSKDRYGATENFHVLNRHPGNASRMFLARKKDEFKWDTLNAFDTKGNPLVLHLFDKVRPNQSRGVPYLAPVIELIKQLGRYTDAEVMAAVVSGMLTVFVTNESGMPDLNPAPTEDNPEGDPAKQIDTTGIELGYGNMVGLMPGEKVESPTPGRPNTAFDGFVLAILRQIGVALELPFELLVKHFTNSYSSSKAAFEEAWSYFRRRRTWLVEMFCQPVYEAIITEAVATGRLSAPGFFSDPLIKKAWLGTLWTGDAPTQLNPKQEIDAAIERINARLTSRSEERSKLVGGDWEGVLPTIIREEELLREKGLLPEPKPKQTQQVNPQSNEDEE
jgi:lambda family phage portal protein